MQSNDKTGDWTRCHEEAHTRFTDERNPPAACCDGKRTFETPQLAHHVNVLQAITKGKREVYRCPVCGLWHLGGPV